MSLKKNKTKLEILRKSNFFPQFRRNLFYFGSAIAKLKNSHLFALVFQYSSFANSILEFIKIPTLYGAAWLRGEPIPVARTKNARWGFATLLLSLGIAGLAVPAVSLPLSMVSVSLGLIVGMVLLLRLIYHRREIQRDLLRLRDKIKQGEQAIEALQIKIAQMSRRLKVGLFHDPDEVSLIRKFHEELNQAKIALQELQAKEAALQKRWAKYQAMSIQDRVVSIGFSLTALAGLSCLMVMPFVGLVILAVNSGIAVLYCLTRLVYPWYKAHFNLKPTSQESPGYVQIVSQLKTSPEISHINDNGLEEQEPSMKPDACQSKGRKPSPSLDEVLIDSDVTETLSFQSHDQMPSRYHSCTPR